MPFTDGISPEPTVVTASSTPVYSNPSDSDLAAVAATVSLVGIFMAFLVTWLILRLRRTSQSEPVPTSARPASYNFRPSFAPSEASSKFGFIRKPLRLSHRQKNGSWDFADPDPFSHSKESPFDPTPSQKHRPAPLTLASTYTPRAHRASTHKDEFGPRIPSTPGTPASMDFIESPPPAYCPDGSSWQRFQPRDLSPS